MIATLHRLEQTLLPFPDTTILKKGRMERVELSISEKVGICANRAFSLLVNTLLLPVAALYSSIRCLSSSSKAEETVEAIEDLAAAYPDTYGFSQSLFQDEGLGTYASPTQLEGVSNWDSWLDAPHVEGEGKAGPEYRKFFVRILSNPKPFVEILKNMGVNAHRFSFEWAILESEQGKIDPVAVELYKNFLKELKNAGIEPWGTLHHFVLPQWAEDAGGFANEEIRDHFVGHSLKMMELFPETSHWMTFNEPGAYALQAHLRGVYPPGKVGDFQGAGQILRNMMAAHCNIYREAKQRHGDRVQIGITHQWLKFVPLEGNPLERLICYMMSKITHYSVYNFFKTGRLDFEMPGKANIHLEVPEEEFEEHGRFLDFIAPQFYGFTRLKMGLSGGETYPGYGTKNGWGFSFGASCPEGGKMQFFGPGFYPESLNECLAEAAELDCPIAITETGCDAMIQKWGDPDFAVDEETQESYFKAIAPILNKYKEKISAIFIWTLIRGQLEWDRGDGPALGILPVKVDQDRNIVGYSMTPSARLIQSIFQGKAISEEAG